MNRAEGLVIRCYYRRSWPGQWVGQQRCRRSDEPLLGRRRRRVAVSVTRRWGHWRLRRLGPCPSPSDPRCNGHHTLDHDGVCPLQARHHLLCVIHSLVMRYSYRGLHQWVFWTTMMGVWGRRAQVRRKGECLSQLVTYCHETVPRNPQWCQGAWCISKAGLVSPLAIYTRSLLTKSCGSERF